MDINIIQQYAIQFLGDYWGPVCVVMLCGLCAMISAVMAAPTETSGSTYKALYRVINVLGLNVFKAKNAGEVVVTDNTTQAVAEENKTATETENVVNTTEEKK